ncbi:MAG: hypothetical protein QOD92_3328 [Acidimicrobiaceae bacterium]|jgi:hypothetical protein
MAHVSRQRLATAIFVVFALAACSDSKSKATSSTDSAGQPVETSIVIGPDGSSSVVVVPNDTTPGNGGAPSVGNPSPGPDQIDSTGPPGSFAPAILRPSQSSEVVVEVRTQAGAGPQQASLDHLTSVLRSVTGKTVTVTGGPSIGGGATSWSADDLRSTGAAGAAQGNGRAVIHLLFVHGDFSGDSSVLGVAVRGDTAAVFVDQVNGASTPLVGSGGIESAVVTHEVGHLMGLVDLFLHTGRQDPDHPGHSTNPGSVMYWAVESNLVADLLQGGPPKDFDSADLADLQTIRSSG